MAGAGETRTGQNGDVAVEPGIPGVGSIRTPAPWAGGLGITEPRRTEPSQATRARWGHIAAVGRAKDGQKVARPSPIQTDYFRAVKAAPLVVLGRIARSPCCNAAEFFLYRPHRLRSHRLAVRTPPSHGGNRGSIPLGSANLSFPSHVESARHRLSSHRESLAALCRLDGEIVPIRCPAGRHRPPLFPGGRALRRTARFALAAATAVGPGKQTRPGQANASGEAVRPRRGEGDAVLEGSA